MIYYLLLPIFSLLLVVFQMTVLDQLFFHSIGVEVTIVAVIYAGFRLDVLRGGILSFILGLFMDYMTGPITGLFALLYVLIFLVSLFVSFRFYTGRLFFVGVHTLCCVLLEGLLIFALFGLIYDRNDFYPIVAIFVPQALAVSLLSPLFFKMFDRFEVLLSGKAR